MVESKQAIQVILEPQGQIGWDTGLEFRSHKTEKVKCWPVNSNLAEEKLKTNYQEG